MLRILPALEGAFDVELATLRSGGALEADVPPGVGVHVVGSLGWVRAALGLRRIIRQRAPAVVLGFQEAANIPLLLGLRLIGRTRRPPVAISTQSAPSVVLADSRPRTRVRVKFAMRTLYPLADTFVVAADGVGRDLEAIVPGVSPRVRRIYNAGIDASVTTRAKATWDHPFLSANVPLLVACGRLTEQKDYPTLLRAVGRWTDRRRPVEFDYDRDRNDRCGLRSLSGGPRQPVRDTDARPDAGPRPPTHDPPSRSAWPAPARPRGGRIP